MASAEAVLPPTLQPWARLCGSAAEFEQVWKEVEEKQAQSIAAKKRLADDTRNFERLPDPERLEGIPVLLKAYQAEIGALSKRAKYAEAGLAEFLKSLREAPTPEKVQDELKQFFGAQARLHAGVNRDLEETLKQREAQVAKLAAAAADCEAELQTMKNQDVTVRRLQKQIKELEAGSEAGFADARRQRDEEWAKKLEDLRQEVEMARGQTREALAQVAQQRELREEELERVRRERLEEQRRAEEATLARNLEVESLSSDLERLQAELEHERLQRAELKETPHETQGSVKVLQSLLDGAQQRALGLEREVGDLHKQLAEAASRAQSREAELQLEREQLADSAAAQEAQVQALREQLALRPSFDQVAELKQQLRNIDVVELSDEGAAATDLERRLLQRQKVLEGQLTEARVRTGELAAEGDALREKLQAAEDGGKDLRRLIERLEAELAGGGAAVSGQSPAAAASKEQSFEKLLPAGGHGQSVAASEAMPSMLDIVTGQRDRLRERLGDLEQERDRWRTSAEEERKRAETLHKDNVRLLERARYLQSLQPKKGGGGGLGRARGTATGAAERDLENRYGAAYEDSLAPSNPWEQFREDEKARRVASFSAGERALVLMGSALLSSKVVRLFVLGYASAMHLLVFAVLLRLAQMHHNC